jgi:alkylresorcinol/alkylpyrone synthase
VAFTPHRYNQDEDARELTGFAEPGFMRFAQTAGVVPGLFIADVSRWVCHPGGPKVLDSIGNALGLPDEALAHSRNSMRDNGNVSSVSVLDVLRRAIAEPPAAGAFGVLLAMGPGFSFELLLLRW